MAKKEPLYPHITPSQKKKEFVLPTCPNCGKLLNYVHENIYEVYDFNEGTGTYIEDTEAGKLEVNCPFCEFDLGDLFGEGACNYQAERKK